MYNFDPYNVLLAIATNIPQRLKTGAPGSQICKYIFKYISGESSVVTCGSVYPGFGLRRVN